MFIFLYSFFSFAEPIITDSSKLDLLLEKFRKNPHYIKRGFIKYKILDYEIGKSQTPFYLDGDLAKRFYRKENKCFEVTIYPNENISSPKKCFDKKSDLFLPGRENFRLITLKELHDQNLKGFKFGNFSQTFNLLAYLHTYDVFMSDRSVFGSRIEQIAPRTPFKVSLDGNSEIIIENEKIILNQKLNLFVEKIGILKEANNHIENTVELKSQGMIFTNDLGQILIYNPYLPKPFGDYHIRVNPELVLNLSKLASTSLNSPACFRDQYVLPGPSDCHHLIFKKNSLGHIYFFSILSIDFQTQKVDFL